MLNNRNPNNNNNRRRGRNNSNNPRPQGNNSGGGRGVESANRIDNRARGNAAQLLEKYKTLARDSHMHGDRVLTEYYLQFADHYFRVLADTRARQEETRRLRDDWNGEEGEAPEAADAEDRGDEGGVDDFDPYPQAPQAPRQQQNRNQQQNEPRQNEGRAERDGNRESRPPRDNYSGEGNRDREPRQNNSRNKRYDREENEAPVETDRIDAAILPPAFVSADVMPMVDDEIPAPKPRARRPRKVEAAVE